MTNIEKKFNDKKIRTLFIALAIDIIGKISYLIPFLGEGFDFVWAPISAGLIYIFLGKNKLASAFGFIEEILPGTDIVPTATILWINDYVKNKNETFENFLIDEKTKEKAIKVFYE